jgi:short-subunit dehydrogenase
MPSTGQRTAAVVVVGATTAAGRAVARRFAERGHDLLLVAPERMALERLADDLRIRSGVEVVPIVADLADSDAPYWVDGIVHDSGLDLHGLVTVGEPAVSTRFAETDAESIHEAITRAVTAIALLSRLLLPRIVATSGLLVHIAPARRDGGTRPGHAVEAASAAFLASLTASIRDETNGSGLRTIIVPVDASATADEASMAESLARTFARIDAGPERARRRVFRRRTDA